MLAAATAPSLAAQPGEPYPARVARPVLTIGGEGANANSSFGSIDAIGISSDGRIYVLDGLESCVKVFSADGRFLLRFGRLGSGPGEFVRSAGLSVVRDTVRVLDNQQNRDVVFTLDGMHVRTVNRLRIDGELWMDRSAELRYGFLYQDRASVVAPGRQPLYDPYEYVTVRSPSAGTADTLARLRLDAVLVAPRDPTMTRAVLTGFGRAGVAVRSGDSLIVIADATARSVRWYSITPRGAVLERTARLARTGPAVSAAEQRAMEARVAGEEMWRGRGALSFSGATPRWTIAEWGLFSSDGAFWSGALDHRTGTNAWTAFPMSGEPYEVAVPADFRLRAVQSDRLYGRAETASGVPVVSVYRMTAK